MITRPMLAVDYDPALLKFPVIASPKIDGLRCYKAGGKVLTRSGKLQPNPWVRELIGTLPDGLDGELVTGDFRESSSDLRRTWGKPEFKYYVFDYVESTLDRYFKTRLEDLWSVYKTLPNFVTNWLRMVPQKCLESFEDLEVFETKALELGYEGVILRDPYSPYKCNRSTLKEGYMLKVKRFVDGEAEIIAFFEQEENTNDEFKDDLGFTKRTSHQEGKVGKNLLGGIIVRDCTSGVTFNIGTGLGWTIEFRQQVWHHQDQYRGRIITYKHLPHGNYDVPRNASMKGFREEWDL